MIQGIQSFLVFVYSWTISGVLLCFIYRQLITQNGLYPKGNINSISIIAPALATRFKNAGTVSAKVSKSYIFI